MNIFNYEFLEDRLYDKEHCWLKKEGELFRIGVTDFFQKNANEIVFVELPAAGRNIEVGKNIVSVESGKWVGRIKGTLGGTVVNTNGELADFPYLLNENPYGDGWLIDVKPSGSEPESDFFDLSNPDSRKEYESFLEAEIQRIKSMAE